jgi:hypothetical protein
MAAGGSGLRLPRTPPRERAGELTAPAARPADSRSRHNELSCLALPRHVRHPVTASPRARPLIRPRRHERRAALRVRTHPLERTTLSRVLLAPLPVVLLDRQGVRPTPLPVVRRNTGAAPAVKARTHRSIRPELRHRNHVPAPRAPTELRHRNPNSDFPSALRREPLFRREGHGSWHPLVRFDEGGAPSPGACGTVTPSVRRT